MISVFENYSDDELQDIIDNSHSYSEILTTVGLNVSSGNYKTLHKIIDTRHLNIDKMNKNRKTNPHYKYHLNKEISLAYYLRKNTPCNSFKLKNKLFLYNLKERKCEICGIVDWLGKELSFQLHHKDGDNTNNTLENLQILCPNCHSQTENYAGKNIKTKNESICLNCGKTVSRGYCYCRSCAGKIKAEKYKEENNALYYNRDFLKENIYKNSFEEVGRQCNTSGNTIKKWCKKLNLPYKRCEIIKYSKEEWDLL